jgi:hypothetical protein
MGFFDPIRVSDHADCHGRRDLAVTSRTPAVFAGFL